MRQLLSIALVQACLLAQACEESISKLQEKRIESIPSMIDGHVHGYDEEGESLFYMGNCHDWHQFYYHQWFIRGNELGSETVTFRCRNLNPLSLAGGKAAYNGSIMRVAKIDIETRTVVLDTSVADGPIQPFLKETLIETEPPDSGDSRP